MSHYDTLIEEIYTLELMTVGYVIREEQIFYVAPYDFKLPELKSFLRIKGFDVPNYRYSEKLPGLQRKAISETRILESAAKR